MASKLQIKIAIGLAVYLLFVGVCAYAFFSDQKPDIPVRMMLHTTAGKVLFDHKTHAGDTGYALSCNDCHHHPPDTDEYVACGDCHTPGDTDPVPETCLDCHDESEVEDFEMIKRGDAFHGQCIVCHKEYGAGPMDCAQCHVL